MKPLPLVTIRPGNVGYEHACPGDVIHVDTKKPGRIERVSHHVTGDRRDSVDGADREFLFVYRLRPSA